MKNIINFFKNRQIKKQYKYDKQLHELIDGYDYSKADKKIALDFSNMFFKSIIMILLCIFSIILIIYYYHYKTIKQSQTKQYINSYSLAGHDIILRDCKDVDNMIIYDIVAIEDIINENKMIYITTSMSYYEDLKQNQFCIQYSMKDKCELHCHSLSKIDFIKKNIK
jgi:hypothetical protein